MCYINYLQIYTNYLQILKLFIYVLIVSAFFSFVNQAKSMYPSLSSQKEITS